MNSTKIIVIQLKELIMTILFSVLGVILLGILIYIFIPKDKIVQSNSYIPGKYTSSIVLGNTTVDIEIEVDNQEITAINFLNFNSEQEVFYPLVEPAMAEISKKIIDKQSLNIEIPEDSSATSNMLLEAIRQALNKAIPQ